MPGALVVSVPHGAADSGQNHMSEAEAPRRLALAIVSAVSLLAALGFFVFSVSERYGNPVACAMAGVAVMASGLAVGVLSIGMLLPRRSRIAEGAREVSVMALMVAGLMFALECIGLMVNLLAA